MKQRRCQCMRDTTKKTYLLLHMCTWPFKQIPGGCSQETLALALSCGSQVTNGLRNKHANTELWSVSNSKASSHIMPLGESLTGKTGGGPLTSFKDACLKTSQHWVKHSASSPQALSHDGFTKLHDPCRNFCSHCLSPSCIATTVWDGTSDASFV